MVDTVPVWETIFRIPIGQFIAWIVVLATIITGIVTTTIKLYKFFEKIKDLKTRDEEKNKMLQEHDAAMVEIKNALREIKADLKEQKEVNLKQIRHDMVEACENAIMQGFVTPGRLRSLEELFEEYTQIFHGNGYVKTLMNKVRALPVSGSLEE